MRLTRLRKAFTSGPIAYALVAAMLVVPPALLASREAQAPVAGPAGIGPAAASFSFGVGGDFGANDATAANLDALAGMGTAFFLTIGDLSYNQITPESAWCDYVKQRVGQGYPFEVVSGDHEDDDGPHGDIDTFAGCLPNRVAGMKGTYAKEYYFDYPPAAPLVRSIMISPGITLDGGTYRYKPGTPHYAFLEQAIDSARAAGIPWVVVGMHKPCLSMGIIESCGAGRELFDLLVAKRVDLIFQGHDHTYQRGKQIATGAGCPAVDPASFDADCITDAGADGSYAKGGGLVHVVVGTAGGALFDTNVSDPQAGYFARWMGDNDAAKRHGFLRFDVSPTQLTGQFVSGRSGGFTDTFTIAGTAALSAAPSSLAFGTRPVNSAGSPQAVTVTNTTGGPVAVTSAGFSGANAADFLKASDGCSGAVLGPQETCSVGVSFLPTGTGPRAANLVLGNPTSPLFVPLSGTGAPGAVGFNPASLGFGDQAVGARSAPKAVTVTNRSKGSLTLGAPSRSGPDAADFEVSGGCSGRTLAAGASCSLSVAFAPRGAGARSAMLLVPSDQAGSPHALALTGTGSGGGGGTGGYWLVARDGGIFAFGDAEFQGSTGDIRLVQPIVGMAPTPGGKGYWLVASDGGLFAFGDAKFFGSTGDIRLVQPIVAMAPTPSGNGYWLVARDGGIFAFGDAKFHGSTGDIKLAQPIVAMSPTPTGRGYWLVASDGGIFAFGDAKFHGSTGDIELARPIVTMTATPTGAGYWLTASDGGIFAFGDAVFQGSTGDIRLVQPIVGMTATRSGRGYWMVASDGGIFAFGDARFLGSTGAITLNQPIVGLAVR